MTPTKFLLDIWKYQAQPNSFFCISTKKVDSDRPAWRDHFLQWPVSVQKVKALLRRFPDTKYHVYFCPNPFREPIRRREFVLGSSLLWADLDESHPQQCDPIPQIAWESSPGRFAALWILNKFHTALEIEPVNRGLTYHAKADKAGWDLTQVLRIPGLRNCKYPEKPRAQLLWMHNNEYTLSKIPLGVEERDPIQVLRNHRKKMRSSTYRLLTQRHATVGKRSEVIWRLENELTEQGLDRNEVFSLIKGSVWNKFRGRRDEDRQLRRELDKVSARKEPPAVVRAAEDDFQKERKKKAPQEMKEGLLRLDTVEPESVRWLWYPYLPRGKLVIVEGDPGLGKSWLTAALSHHIASRKRFPKAKKLVGGSVLMMSAEDGIADTIRPRFDNLGADVSKVWLPSEYFTLDEAGLDILEEYLEEVKPTLTIIDPLVAYMGSGVDLHKANETREVMAALASLAEEYSTTILCVRHLRKGTADKSIYRGMGSIDLTAAARSVLLVGKDPNDEDARAIVHIKSNLGPLGPTLRYELRPSKTRSFRWAGTTDLTADQMLKNTKEAGRSERTLAREFLKKTVNRSPKPMEDIVREAEARGISENTLIKLRREEEINVIKISGKIHWVRA